MDTTKFVVYHHWLDSRGREHKVTALRATIAQINRWARNSHLNFKPDSSLFGGCYLAPDDSWYEVR